MTPKELVSREMLYCVSSLVSTLNISMCEPMPTTAPAVYRDFRSLLDQAMELAAPVADYEEAAREAGWDWDEGGPHFYRNRPGASAFEPYEYQHIHSGNWQELCEAEEIDPYDREVYGHWIVSEWLADKLIEKGEKVDKDFAGMIIWARTAKDQPVESDPVITQIAAEHNLP